MKVNPEDISQYVVRPIDDVRAKLGMLAAADRRYQDLYDKLAGMLKRYPPHTGFFSIPVIDLQTNSFVVKNEGGFLVVRARYYPELSMPP
jgi:hypothetical protein